MSVVWAYDYKMDEVGREGREERQKEKRMNKAKITNRRSKDVCVKEREKKKKKKKKTQKNRGVC